ncbi:hypothetical protein A3K93_02400 [Acinetobacter sp. NCu2D-2]|uniref:PilW family protein n=1 Tax=Acinetobacter sp. NCu2D-2 TaxID=1608473 RepID=UPI0007CDDAF5|nr:hypothetical protein [Acinetobacter sp. NCu2D-2]ANF81152.1 hypothetical protein A3K93_02400 [Acinetobacter sp. NCu2D-2]
MKKNGFSILELLVGLVVAMLCMIMMLMTFKQISKVSLESSMDAEYDTQVQLGMLVLQKVIQNAGYGSGNAADILMSNNTLYLRFTPDLATPTIIKCQALTSENDIVNKEYKLFLLENTTNCEASTALNSIAWTNSNTIKSPLITIKNKEISATTPPIFSFSVQSLPSPKKCTPYGISNANPSGTKFVTVTAQGQHITQKQIQSLICLNNI